MSDYVYSKPERGGCLSFWLGASLVVSVMALFVFLGLGSELSRRGFSWIVLFGFFAVAVNLACIYGIYKWKQWGVYGFVAASIMSLVLEMISQTVTARDFVAPFIQIGILWYLIKDKWDYFD